MQRLHIATPLIESRALSDGARRAVWLKIESMQPSGSFKIRGIGHACQEYHRRGAHRFISSSGGNAGLAVAYAGRRLGVPVTVVVPHSTSARARELLAAERAELVVVQDGQRLQFTSSWKHSAEVRDLVVLPRKTGQASIDLRREDGTVRVVAIR